MYAKEKDGMDSSNVAKRGELRIGNNQMPKACIQEIEGIGCIKRESELL